ncbi:TolC family protein, partial [Acinetobacter baumannii]
LAERRLLLQRLQLERDVGLAWVDVWRPQQALELARTSLREAGLQLETARIAYANGRGSQAEVRAASLAKALLKDDIAGLEQEEAHARANLS